MITDLEVWEEIDARWPVVAASIDSMIQQRLHSLAAEGSTADIGEVRRLQGEINALRQVKELPKSQLRSIEQNRKANKHE